MKLTNNQKQHKKSLKKLSKKELIKKAMVYLDLAVNMMQVTENLRAELTATKKIL